MRGKLEGFDTISHLDGQLDGERDKQIFYDVMKYNIFRRDSISRIWSLLSVSFLSVLKIESY